MTEYRYVKNLGTTSQEIRKKVLFLGYSEENTRLISVLQMRGCSVWHAYDKINDFKGFDLIITFGYRHIIPLSVLKGTKSPIINLHIGYLPFNRGAHPNFWSFFDGTPSGVTIHQVDEGIDTGDIIFQKYVNFDRGEQTFKDTYTRLVEEVEQMFEDGLDTILNGRFVPIVQRGDGTFHSSGELPSEFSNWDVNIYDEIKRLEKLGAVQSTNKIKIIDEIEAVRANNNVNWMDLLRLAFTAAPKDAKEIVKRINHDDGRISDLLKKLGE